MIADLEFVMTKTLNILSLSTLALVGAMFTLPAISTDANASATSKLMRCQFLTKQKVVDCCQRVLRTEKKPYWLHDTGGSCSSAAVCVPGKPAKLALTHVAAVKKPRCFIKMVYGDTPIKGGDTPRRENNRRSPNHAGGKN
jgi:hypothetical protein